MAWKVLIAVFLTVHIPTPATLADNGFFWHITDHHYDTTYWDEMRSCNDEVPVRGIYGDYWCDAPWRLVQDSIAAMAAIKPDVDFIIWTGDNVAHIKDEYTNETYVVNVLKRITDELKAVYPGVKVYATMGNHDWHPDGQFPDSTHRLYNDTADLWADWIDDPEQLNNFRRGAYYTVKTSHGLRIVGLNTNVYYTSDKLTADLDDPVGQFSWLQHVLTNASQAGEKVLLTGHVPPGLFSPSKVMWFRDKFNTRLVELVQAFADVIVAMFMGHEHNDMFRHIKRNGGGPGVPMYMAPSLTPWRYKIPGNTGSPHNPGIRLVEYDRTTGAPLDILQYYTDLTLSNVRNDTNWTLSYRMSDLYGMDDLSAVSLDNAIKKLAEDDTLMDKFIINFDVRGNGNSRVESCKEMCRAAIQCCFDIMYSNEVQDCVDAQVGASAKALPYSPLILISLATLVWSLE